MPRLPSSMPTKKSVFKTDKEKNDISSHKHLKYLNK